MNRFETPSSDSRIPMAKFIPRFMVLLLLAMNGGSLQAQAYSEDNIVYSDHVKFYELEFLFKGDDLSVSVTIDWDELGDIYIMTWPEVKRLQANETFKAQVYKERINNVTFKWHQPDDKTYYLVIDNMDNARPDDAAPYSEIVYSLEYVEKSNFGHRTLILFVVAVVVTIILCSIAGLVAFKLNRGRWPRLR